MRLVATLIEVSGKVQGVFFRVSTKEVCENLGITGWVKNLPNGNVLIHAQGSEQQMVQLKGWCKEGPPLSKVDQLIVTETKIVETSDFVIER